MSLLEALGPTHPRATFVVPGGLDGVTGGNLYDRAVIGTLEPRGWSVAVIEPDEPVPPSDVVVMDSLSLRHGPSDTDAKVAILLHQLPSEAEGRPEWRAREAAALGGADLVITVSEALAASVRSDVHVDPVVIPPGWDGAVAARRDTHPTLVLCVANAHPGKGVPEAALAYALAGPIGSGLVIVGDADRDRREGRRLRAVLARCPHPVTLAGVVPAGELSRLYARSLVFVTASRYEGWPIAVAEAMASGVPVAAFDAPGVRDLVRDGVDGALAPVGDVGALSQALAGLARDPERARRTGREAMRRARRWPTWRETGNRFAEELERVALRPPALRSPRSRSSTRTP